MPMGGPDEPPEEDDPDFDENEISMLPIDGVLDLHTFSPKEIKELVPDYIEACLDKGITTLRIIHGKGIGNLRRTVHALLERHPKVAGYRLCGPLSGGWGATEVDLFPNDPGGGTPG